MEISSHRHDQLLTPFLVPLPSLACEGWGWTFQASSHDLVLLLTSPHSGSIPEPTSVEQKMLLRLLSPGNYKGFRSPISGMGRQGQGPMHIFLLSHRCLLLLSKCLWNCRLWANSSFINHIVGARYQAQPFCLTSQSRKQTNKQLVERKSVLRKAGYSAQ